MNIPAVGSTVEATVRFRNILLSNNAEYNDELYKGVVVKNAKWINADSFSLNTGNPDYPVSIIPINRVINLKVLSGKSVNIRKFKVKGDSGDYLVIKADNHYSCDCTGFKYRGKCKHIEKVKVKLSK